VKNSVKEYKGSHREHREKSDPLCSQERHSLKSRKGRTIVSSVNMVGTRNFSVIGFRKNLVFLVTLCENKFTIS
jgi:hypothetical protein